MNLKAELEIRALHEKIDTLRESQWAALVVMQQEQIELLQRVLGVTRSVDEAPSSLV